MSAVQANRNMQKALNEESVVRQAEVERAASVGMDWMRSQAPFNAILTSF